jgi:hypothetical protein
MHHTSQAVISRHSRTSCGYLHIRIQVFSYRVPGHLSLADASAFGKHPRLRLSHSSPSVSFTVIVIVLRAISSLCLPRNRSRYLPRSTEPIPSVIHHVVLQISSHLAVLRFLQLSPIRRHCHQVHERVISPSQVILSHPRSHLVAVHPHRRPSPLHPRHDTSSKAHRS